MLPYTLRKHAVSAFFFVCTSSLSSTKTIFSNAQVSQLVLLQCYLCGTSTVFGVQFNKHVFECWTICTLDKKFSQPALSII